MRSRNPETKGLRYEFGAFCLDAPNLCLSKDGASVSVTPKALETLVVLLQQASRVVTKQELLETVWPETFVEEATLTQNIYTLRKILGEDPDRGQYIETVPRRGYRVVVPVRVVDAGEGEGQPNGATLESIAVLPFEVLDASPEMELLGMGMTDALITRLSNLRSLEVRPTSTILCLAPEERNPEVAGRKLRVNVVLAGTVRRAGERLRVTVQLVGVDRGSSLWAEAFDTIYDDIFSVEDAISRRIASTLELQLTRREEERISRPAAATTKAYEAYIRGRYLWNKRTYESLGKSISSYRQALELDPASALAYAGLADAYVLLPLYGDTPPREVFPKAREAANRALGLDPDLSEAHTALAYTRFVYDRRWQEAEEGFWRALALNPNYATAHQWLSFLQAALGRFTEALDHGRRAWELDPLSRVINSDLGLVLYFSGRFEEALEQYRSTLDLEGDFAYAHFGMALAYAALGRFEEAVEEGRRAVVASDSNSAMQAVLGYALARAGCAGEARILLTEIDQGAESEEVAASRLALVHVGLEEDERALDLLEQACDQHSRFVVLLKVWPVFDRLRSQLRFQDLLKSLGLDSPV